MVIIENWGGDSLSQSATDSSLEERALISPLFCFPKASFLEGGGPVEARGSP